MLLLLLRSAQWLECMGTIRVLQFPPFPAASAERSTAAWQPPNLLEHLVRLSAAIDDNLVLARPTDRHSDHPFLSLHA